MPVNATPLSFWRAILYNPNKVFPSQTIVKWVPEDNVYTTDFPNDPEKKFGVMLQFVKFYPISNNKVHFNNPFWIINVHFPLTHYSKMKTIECLKMYCNVICRNVPTLIMGDMNIFMDDGGAEELNELSSFSYNVTSEDKINETFASFPHDIMQIKLCFIKLNLIWIIFLHLIKTN